MRILELSVGDTELSAQLTQLRTAFLGAIALSRPPRSSLTGTGARRLCPLRYLDPAKHVGLLNGLDNKPRSGALIVNVFSDLVHAFTPTSARD
jgi:hypothetical protein